MHNPARTRTYQLLTALLFMNVSACGWVDSTGVQGTTVAVALRNAQPVAILEGTSLTAPLAGAGADLRNWRWQLDESDVRNDCASISGFDEQLAATSLADACSESGECSVLMEESGDEYNTTVFTLTMPMLRSPVALNYRLSATRDDDAIVEREQLLCGLSVNEAPVAIDDTYLAPLDELLIINPSDSNSLLANDYDDDDIRNTELIVTGIMREPAYASQFSFDAMGGFIYAASTVAPVNSDGYAEDSFVYSITDGLHVTQATAFIRIGSGNTAPAQTQQIPDLTINAAFAFSTPESLQFDLSQYFIDADGDSLHFSVATYQLPASGNVTLSSDGQLHTRLSIDDIGTYRLEIEASDGLDTVSDTFTLRIVEPVQSTPNNTPDVTDIRNQTVKNSFSYNVSEYFSDKDSDELSFSATGLPEDVFISTRGVISGQASKDNRGKWNVRVTADDGNGGTVSDVFQLKIK